MQKCLQGLATWGPKGALVRSPTRATEEWMGGGGWGNEHEKVFEGRCEQMQGQELWLGGNGDSRERILFVKTRDGEAHAYGDGNDVGYGDQTGNRERGPLPE